MTEGRSLTGGPTGPPTAAGEAPTPLGDAAGGEIRTLWSDAWYDLRHKPLFWISSLLVVVLITMAAMPTLFTDINPEHAVLANSLEPPGGSAWFGYDLQGRDVYARTIYGARTSILVGVLAMLVTTTVGLTVGIMAGYLGGWPDGVMSRIGDMFLGLPYVLGGIVILSSVAGVRSNPSEAAIMAAVILVLAVLAWPVTARVARSSVLSVRAADYVVAARALGAGPRRLILRHILPNTVAPVIVIATLNVGAFIGAEATLSFLGIGLRSPVISWGVAIADHQDYVRNALHPMLFPALFLCVTVLAFVMLGEAIREALDPKLR
ncbi:MAG: ABC transporter permease subunit [Streptosporangiales bacterium]|nr:ABC transporter permease subunit [Streptosporangiales bacterium]